MLESNTNRSVKKSSNLNFPFVKTLKIKNIAESAILWLFFIFLVWGCASTGYPTGGKKDEKPPVVIKSEPPANALNFTDKEIVIVFDEIVQIKEINQKLVVSPPVNKRPIVSARGNELIIRFEEDLQLNTTYTIDFADAISDNNEGNILQDFRFSFSTGEVVDSLSISGFLFDATNLAPISGALVLAHKNQTDSAFKTSVPVRLAKTNQEGRFSVQNVAPGQYRIYALEDANRNYIYDQPGERIGWLSEVVEPSFEYRERIDSIAPDSVQVSTYTAFLPDSLQLFMFQEDNVPQYIKDSKRAVRNKIDFVFNRPNNEAVQIKLLENPNKKDWFIYERSFAHDSVSLWLKDSVQIKSDSLFLSIQYQSLDSLKKLVYKTDTINAFFFQVGGGEKRTRKKDQQKEVPMLKPESMKRTLEILSDFDIVFPSPVYNYNLADIKLFELIDSIPHQLEFDLVQDSIRLRRFVIDYPWDAGAKYELAADSAAFTDIYGLASSKINQSFDIKPVDSYGIIFVDVANSKKSWVLQILTKQEKLVRQAIVPSKGKMGFQYLKPGDYFLRIFDDINGNGIWDLGDFDLGRQPEPIMYFPETVNVRANWDRLVPWDPAMFDIHDFVKRNRKKNNK